MLSTKKLSIFAIIMFIVGSIDSMRNLPTAALFGSSLIFFFAVGVLLFLLPVALVSAELSSTAEAENGIYYWTRKAFGKRVAFFTVWLQWINTMVWYPSFLSFLAGTAIYVIDPRLTQNKGYLIGAILAIFWLTTLLNWRGIHHAARFVSICSVIGMIIPMVLILALGAIWLFSGKPLQLEFSLNTLIPDFSHSQNWISLTAIVTSFLGMELTAVYIKHMRNPQRDYPKALLISVSFIVITMLFGALAIAFVLPVNQINLVEGIVQAFAAFLEVYHLKWCLPILAALIVIGGLGGIVNWILSPAKSLLAAAQDGQLPKFFCQQNKHGVNTRLLFTQAIVVSLVCTAFFLMPSVNGSYWLLTDLSTQLYVLMYLIMFFAAVVIKYKTQPSDYVFHVSGIKGYGVILCGIIGCGIALVIGFFPPDNINVGSHFHYEIIFSSGLVLMTLPALLMIFIRGIWQRRATGV